MVQTALRWLSQNTCLDNSEEVLSVHAEIASYYTTRVEKYGATPLGVDWTCHPTQDLRFVQLLKICGDNHFIFSLNDIGCGYGALLRHLAKRHKHWKVNYLGIDLSESMIRAAKTEWPPSSYRNFLVSHVSPRMADYSILSGAFNVKLNISRSIWEQVIKSTLSNMHQTSQRGFSVNFLTSLPPSAETPTELYRTSPDQWIHYCETKFAAQVELLEDYGLREFTLLIRPQ
jgi:SAM-dependent methyltransferase